MVDWTGIEPATLKHVNYLHFKGSAKTKQDPIKDQVRRDEDGTGLQMLVDTGQRLSSTGDSSHKPEASGQSFS